MNKYVARIKFVVQPVNSYKIGEVYSLVENNRYIRYRYTADNTFEFVYGNFKSYDEAFEYGKKLYFNLLYLLNLEGLYFELSALNFLQERVFSDGNHANRKQGKEEPEKFYYSNHNFFNNYNGLEIFSMENDDFFDEYDKDRNFNEKMTFEIEYCTDHKYNFDLLTNLNSTYDQDAYMIFSKLNKINKEEEPIIKLVLLSIAYENFAEIVGRFISQKKERNENEDALMWAIKLQCSKEKCRRAICLFSDKKDKQDADKTLNEMYSLRSSFAHGNAFAEKDEGKILQVYHKARKLYLHLIKNFYEEKNNG